MTWVRVRCWMSQVQNANDIAAHGMAYAAMNTWVLYQCCPKVMTETCAVVGLLQQSEAGHDLAAHRCGDVPGTEGR